MTRTERPLPGNQLKSLAALRLHTWARMSRFWPVLLAGLLAPAVAQADLGTCAGGLTGTVGLLVPQGGDLQSVNKDNLTTVYGHAECVCGDSDIQLQIFLTKALPT